MPSIRDTLERLLAIPGVHATVLVGRDGLPLEAVGRGETRFLETLGALGASALSTTEALGQELASGRTVGAILEYDSALVSVDPLGEAAVVVTVAENAASLGNIRQLVRGSRDDILRQLDAR